MNKTSERLTAAIAKELLYVNTTSEGGNATFVKELAYVNTTSKRTNATIAMEVHFVNTTRKGTSVKNVKDLASLNTTSKNILAKFAVVVPSVKCLAVKQEATRNMTDCAYVVASTPVWTSMSHGTISQRRTKLLIS